MMAEWELLHIAGLLNLKKSQNINTSYKYV